MFCSNYTSPCFKNLRNVGASARKTHVEEFEAAVRMALFSCGSADSDDFVASAPMSAFEIGRSQIVVFAQLFLSVGNNAETSFIF